MRIMRKITSYKQLFGLITQMPIQLVAVSGLRVFLLVGVYLKIEERREETTSGIKRKFTKKKNVKAV